jgi:hypothetical protein
VIEQPPLGLGPAVKALAACAARTAALIARRRIRQPAEHVGWRCRFADGTSAVVYRETVVVRPQPTLPVVLVVGFRLRHVRRPAALALFRFKSVLNTLLFAGFPGFVSKLWLAHDEHGLYRGIYDWDDPTAAEAYVRALWWALAVVSDPPSIHYALLPGLRRDELLRNPGVAGVFKTHKVSAWWRVAEVEESRAA